MERTTIVLPPGLKARASRRAKADGVSLAEPIRSTLEKKLAPKMSDEPLTIFNDPFLIIDDGLPPDVPANLDMYLSKSFDEEMRRWKDESSSTQVQSSPRPVRPTRSTNKQKQAGAKLKKKTSKVLRRTSSS